MAGPALPVPILPILANVSIPARLKEIENFYLGAGRDFRIHLDDACALPYNWRQTWAAPVQWGVTGDKNWATKYGAAGFIPRMVEQSPFYTTEWRQASASIVVLFARSYAGALIQTVLSYQSCPITLSRPNIW